MNKINAKRRNKRPECGANAPTFLSAVYKSGTQAKKRQAGAPQYGRSMIEMIGILAIVGILTVAGIIGYSKAMYRYRIQVYCHTMSRKLLVLAISHVPAMVIMIVQLPLLSSDFCKSQQKKKGRDPSFLLVR